MLKCFWNLILKIYKKEDFVMENNTEPNQTPNSSSMDAKTTSWVAYLTWIGFIIAICAGDKEGAKFHLNQALVILLANVAGLILQFIPVIGWILGSLWNVFVLVCWILGLIAAINQEEKEVPLLGKIKILK
jgi:uncharacterized membrane protein